MTFQELLIMNWTRSKGISIKGNRWASGMIRHQRLWSRAARKWRIHWHLRKNPSDKLKNIMTIGIYEGQAFLIKDINTLAKAHECSDCLARFTQASHPQRRPTICAQGRANIDCPKKGDKAPQVVYESTFYNEHQASTSAIRWLQHERASWIVRAPVDG